MKLWDKDSGQLIKTLKGHEDMVNSVSFSPDGKTLASASDDKTVKLWDRDTQLNDASLEQANLEGANLEKAFFSGTNFWRTNLEKANLEGAYLRNVVNLTPEQVKRAKNWEKAKYDKYFYIELVCGDEEQS